MTAAPATATAPGTLPAAEVAGRSATTDLAAAQAQWHDWIRAACEALEVDPDAVDVTGIHALTKDIAHGFARPMAPVGSYILGLAVGAGLARGERPDAAALTDALRATFPATG